MAAHQDAPPPEQGTEAEPSQPLDARALRTAYQDLLGRPPFQSERAAWSGRGLSALVYQLTGGEEFWRHWLEEQLYYFFLIRNFRSESEGVRSLPGDLAAARASPLDALARIVLSPAFDQRNPGADTWVTVVMEQLLALEVQRHARELEIGKALYDGQSGTFLGVRGSSQSDVARIALADPRCARTFVMREHERLLRIPAPPRELKRWVRDVERKPIGYRDLVRAWLISPAWRERIALRKNEPNRLFVRGLFVDLVDRLPEADEERALSDALDGLGDPGPLRTVLVRLLISSGTAVLPEKDEVRDATAWIRGEFERLLARAPSEQELATFARAWHDPACRPETVVTALLSHPEYHQW